jgi:hypothetical protein
LKLLLSLQVFEDQAVDLMLEQDSSFGQANLASLFVGGWIRTQLWAAAVTILVLSFGLTCSNALLLAAGAAR